MTSYPHLKDPPQTEPEWFSALIHLARYLRSPQGCPWDRTQSAADFARFATEEAQELNEAFREGRNEHIAEEWGDTLFTLLAAAAAAEQEGRFSLLEALENCHAKMIRRHGHIFGEFEAATPEDAAKIWNLIKAREKNGGEAPASETP